MSDIAGAAFENNIKPEEEKVGLSSSGLCGFRRKLLLAVLAMFFISAVTALGLSLHFVVGEKDVSHEHKRVQAVHARIGRPLSEYVHPL